jgi:hypothetical protein
MFQALASVAAAVAASITGTRTADTDAAGVRFGPSIPPPPWEGAGRFTLRLIGFNGGGNWWRFDTRDHRAALRKLSTEARRFGIPCHGGPVHSFGRVRSDGGELWAEALDRDGVAVGVVRISRTDGRPIVTRKGARRGGH